MLRRVLITGFGPHDRTELHLDPKGTTLIEGSSESGKSTLAAAVCFCLWGTEPDGKALGTDAIRDGATHALVEIETAKGAVLRRQMDGKRKTTRLLLEAGSEEPRVFGTEAEWQADPIVRVLHKAVGKHLAGRLVLVPFSWVPLADSSGGGRDLRDLLAELVPGQDRDEVARLMKEQGLELRRDDVTSDAKAAASNRTIAKKERDAAKGALTQAEAALAAADTEAVETPGDAEVREAQQTVIAADAWRGYRLAQQRRAEGEQRRANWDARRAELGERPDGDAAAAAKARDAVHADRSTLRAAEEAERRARVAADKAATEVLDAQEATDPEVTEAERYLATMRRSLAGQEEAGGNCRTCGQPWGEAQDELAGTRDEVGKAEAALEKARSGEEKRRAAAVLAAKEAEATALAALAKAEKEVARARKALAKSEAALETVQAEAARVTGYEQALRALGSRPILPDAPDAPAGPEPTQEANAAARALLERAQQAKGAVAQAARTKAAAEGRVAKAREALAKAEAEVARQEALVDAVRRAPSERLRRGLADFDFGCVSFDVEGEGVSVLIDGRSWKRASKGRQVYADMVLRLALRRAVGMRWFPVCADEVSAWSGDLPVSDGPALLLHTTSGPLRVAELVQAAK